MSGLAAVRAAHTELALSFVPETAKTSSGNASPTKVRCRAAMASPIGSTVKDPDSVVALPSMPGSGGGSGGSGRGANGEAAEVPLAAAATPLATPFATELKK